MPTEEVFTAPHRLKTTGVIKSSMPLSYNGNVINEFFIELKNGKIINFGAKVGYNVLKNLISTDKGTYTLPVDYDASGHVKKYSVSLDQVNGRVLSVEFF